MQNANVNVNELGYGSAGFASEGGFFSGLDASSSKQLAALTAAGNARRAQAQAQAQLQGSGGGLTSANYLGQIPRPDFSAAAFAHTPSLSASPSTPVTHVTAVTALPAGLGPAQDMQQQQQQHAINPYLSQSQQQQQHHQHLQQQQQQQQQQRSQHALANYRSRQLSFLQGIARVMVARNIPLPAAITGVDIQGFDPASSPWKHLEPGSDVGTVKLAGRDVDLFKLWLLVFQLGGGVKMQSQSAWLNILPSFSLPDQLPQPQENGNTSTAVALAQLYMSLLGSFDEYYNKSMSDAQRTALANIARPFYPDPGAAPSSYQHVQAAQPPPANTPALPGPSTSSNIMNSNNNSSTNIPSADQSTSGASLPPPADAPTTTTEPNSAGTADAENDARKRKLGEADEADLKRSRRKTEAEPPATSNAALDAAQTAQMAAPAAGSAAHGKMRRKIEYIPFSREIETAGGRNVHEIQSEILRLSRGQPLRDIHEWGKVYVDSLTMSIRSRISTELSYGLTTLILLSTMRSAAPDTGFLVGQCEELLEEVLDLLEELAFSEEADTGPSNVDLITNRQLVQFAHDEYSEPFASDMRLQGEYDPMEPGPSQRKGDLIRLILNILRNLTAITDNQKVMAEHPVLTDLLLRLVDLRVDEGGLPKAASKALSLPDLIVVRKDVLSTFVNLSSLVALQAPSSSISSAAYSWRARRLFELVSSYLVDPIEALSPSAILVQTGVPFTPQTRAPLLPDVALEVFTRISCLDDNRKAISRAVPKEWQRQLFDSIIHRLPSVEMDFKLAMRDESWLSYVQKLTLAMYSLAFLMPTEMKTQIKQDRYLSFGKTMLRFVKKLMYSGQMFIYCARRSIEAMKLIDDAADMFDTKQPRVPTLAFGVGYGEANDKDVELGSGLLSAHREEVLWTLMMHSDLDDVMFSELESLARVEPTVAVH